MRCQLVRSPITILFEQELYVLHEFPGQPHNLFRDPRDKWNQDLQDIHGEVVFQFLVRVLSIDTYGRAAHWEQ